MNRQDPMTREDSKMIDHRATLDVEGAPSRHLERAADPADQHEYNAFIAAGLVMLAALIVGVHLLLGFRS